MSVTTSNEKPMNNEKYSIRFFPERFRLKSAQLCRSASQRLLNSPINMPSMEDFEALQHTAFSLYNDALMKLPFEQRPIRPTPIVSAELSLAFHYAKFYIAGRQIYEVGDGMLGILAGADYRDVPASMLVLPFPSIYLHFGPQQFRIKGAPFEGAIVSVYKSRFEFVFTTSQTPGFLTGNMVTHRPQYLYLSLDIADVDADQPLGELVDAAIAKEQAALTTAAEIPLQDICEEGVHVIDRRGEASKEDLENFNIAIASLDEAMRLVVNTIIFITSYKEHVHSRWSEDMPEALRAAADGAGRPKQVNQAKAAVREEGYYKTHFVGDRFDYQGGEELGSTGAAVQPHWRRSHWRVQRYGPGLQERKAVLIKQVLVNAKKLADGQIVPGRITKI